MTDIRFLSALHRATPTTFDQARRCTSELVEVVEKHTSARDRCPIEGAIAALYAGFLHFCQEADYDPIGVAEILLARDGQIP